MMVELVLALIGLVLVGGFLILPIIALVRTLGLGQLRRRVQDLEDEVENLRRRFRTLSRASSETAHLAAPHSVPDEVHVVPEVQSAEVIQEPSRPLPEERKPRTTSPPQPSRSVLTGPTSAAGLENLLGQYVLGWLAVILLLFATGFFLKYAFENQWIGEMGRITLGVVAGVGLCVAALRSRQQGRWLFAQMLTAAGIVLLYLCTFSAFGYYQLIPQERASIYLVILVAEAAALALLYEAPAIALMAVVGGLLTPVLMHSDRDQYLSLFTYLGLLNVGVVLVTLFRDFVTRTARDRANLLVTDTLWSLIAPIALLGTQILFWAWYVTYYHPEKLAAALLFQGALFVLFLIHDVLAPVVRQRPADVIGLVQVVVNAFFFALAGTVLLEPDYHLWLAPLAVCLAIVYALLAFLLHSWKQVPERSEIGASGLDLARSEIGASGLDLARSEIGASGLEDERLVLVVVATGMAFVAVALGLRGEAGWVSLGWAVQGVALSIFGMRIRSVPLRSMGAALLALALGRLVFVDTPWDGREPFVFVFNRYGLPGLAIAGCLLAAGLLSRRLLAQPNQLDLAARWVAGLGGVIVVWFVLSFEVYQSLAPSPFAEREPEMAWSTTSGTPGQVVDHGGRPTRTRSGPMMSDDDAYRLARMSLSVFWAIYAAGLLGVGFWLNSRPLRGIALGLFAVTLGKVILVDLAGLPGFYRVAAFFALAVMMGLGAWIYQRVSPALASEPTGSKLRK